MTALHKMGQQRVEVEQWRAEVKARLRAVLPASEPVRSPRVVAPPPPVEPAEPVLTPVEIAARLRVSKETVYRAIRAGELPSVRIGSMYRVPLSAYNAWYEGQQT